MTEEKWEEIKEMVNKNFEVLANEISELPKERGQGTKEDLIFIGPLGKMKLEFIIKPLVIGRKTHYSKRMGTSAKVDYITSETEKVRTFLAHKWDEAAENWTEIDAAQFGQ
ncbi:MAG: hypothetical protein NTX00_04670 [Candidatus Parcubacteria bacterium]|nr:hypothetical protein [Candidatus Parcubacteria bacterium]